MCVPIYNINKMITNYIDSMKKLLLLAILTTTFATAGAKGQYDNSDTLYVSLDRKGEFKSIAKAIEVCRAFMEYHKVIFIRNGVYREKLVIPSWLTNVELCGESADKTVITWDDHATRFITGSTSEMGTFRTYTLKIEGNDITLKNLTVANTAGRVGQAVALHTEGDRIKVLNCRLLGNQDTVYMGVEGTRVFYKDSYIEGTTDFIFGPSIAWFEGCEIRELANSYVTAASTPENQKFGYVFNNCKITADDSVKEFYLGRPWRRFAKTLFMHCELSGKLSKKGWKQWSNAEEGAELTNTQYQEFENSGEGAQTKDRVEWSKVLSKKEASKITPESVFGVNTSWIVE